MPEIAYCSRHTISRSVSIGPPFDFTVTALHETINNNQPGVRDSKTDGEDQRDCAGEKEGVGSVAYRRSPMVFSASRRWIVLSHLSVIGDGSIWQVSSGCF